MPRGWLREEQIHQHPFIQGTGSAPDQEGEQMHTGTMGGTTLDPGPSASACESSLRIQRYRP